VMILEVAVNEREFFDWQQKYWSLQTVHSPQSKTGRQLQFLPPSTTTMQPVHQPTHPPVFPAPHKTLLTVTAHCTIFSHN
jgi:hypothetical protein